MSQQNYDQFHSRFAAVEGTDGSGKQTAVEQVVNALSENRVETEIFAFPRYQTPAGRKVRRYLDNKFGPATEIHHDLASFLYTVDRHLAADEIRSNIALGKFVIADRFTGSNLAHQGAKIQESEQRRNYYEHLIRQEFSEWQIPRPEFNFVLFVTASIARARREGRERQDGHESDEKYQGRVASAYEELCEIYPNWFIPVDCMDGDKQLPPERVGQLLVAKMKEVL